MSIEVKSPEGKLEFEEYYRVRFETLREPWGFKKGCEKDEMEEESHHALALEKGIACGVCRLQLNSSEEGQVRYMGVGEKSRGKGVGKGIMRFMEEKAIELKLTRIILHARENAVPFYKSLGYEILEESYLLWEEIQHYKMEKKLID